MVLQLIFIPGFLNAGRPLTLVSIFKQLDSYCRTLSWLLALKSLCWRFVGEGGGVAGFIIRNQIQIPSELNYIEHGFFLRVLIVKVAAASIRLDSGIR